MDRRFAIKGLLSALGIGAFAAPAKAKEEDLVRRFGASMPAPSARQPQKAFSEVYAPFNGVAKETGKNVFLFHNLQKEIGEIEPHWQGTDPETGEEGEGDCVGQAGAMGADILAATEIHDLGERERFVAKASVEMAYALSRVEIGGGQLSGRGGSHGEWMARAFKEYGVLHRLKYESGGNSLDLTGYDPGRARQYRDKGVPDWLEPIAREHPIKNFVNIRSGQEALDAICARMPVLLCSSYAFEDVRGPDGFANAYLGGGSTRTRTRFGWRWFNSGRLQWWHAMLLTGAILEGPRIGGVVQNSHGKWNSGPRPYDMPEGSMGVDLEVLDLMAKDWGDCWALSSYEGHKAKTMKHRLYR